MPTIEEIFKCNINTKTHVPINARDAWGQCVAAALSHVEEFNDTLAWIELLMLLVRYDTYANVSLKVH